MNLHWDAHVTAEIELTDEALQGLTLEDIRRALLQRGRWEYRQSYGMALLILAGYRPGSEIQAKLGLTRPQYRCAARRLRDAISGADYEIDSPTAGR